MSVAYRYVQQSRAEGADVLPRHRPLSPPRLQLYALAA